MITDAVREWDPERHAHRLAPAGALLAVFGGCVGGVPGLLTALVGVGLLLASCYSRRDGLLILGPLTHAELLRAARRRRPWLWRSLYALAAGAVILGNVERFAPGTLSPSPPYYPPSQIAYINSAVTSFSGVVLAIYAVFLTLQLTPSIVAEEREAKRWELLLTTDLRPREILLGKATARLLLVVEPLLAVLPVFAIMPLLGGLSPVAVALYGVALLAIVGSTAAVCVFYSLFAATPHDARGHAIVWMLAYYGASSAALRLSALRGPFWLDVPLHWLAAGNPAAMVVPAAAGATFEATLLAGLPRLLAFHAAVVFVYGLMACRRLRFAVPWKKRSLKVARQVRRAEARRGPTPGKPVEAATATARPPVGEYPLAWWTRYGHRRGALGVDVTHPLLFNAILFTILAALFVASYAADYFAPWLGLLSAVRVATPVCVWFLTVPLFLRPLSHAAGSIAGERQADTLTGVLLMPLTSREVVIEKWRGSVLESTNVYYFLLAFGLAATLTGFLHPLSLPILAAVVWPGRMLAAAVGVYFSAAATTAARAKRWAATAVYGGGAVALMAFARLVNQVSPPAFDGWPALLAIPLPPATTFFPAALGTFLKEEVPPHAYVTGAFCVTLGCLAQSFLAYAVVGAAAQRFERSRGQ